MPKTAEHLRKFRFMPGHKNISPGRPKEKTLKEYAREYLSSLTDKEQALFFNSLDPAEVWRMAEGNPSTATDITTKGKPIYFPSELLDKNDIPQSTSDNS